ncbi:hypothetical protein E3N88_20100 [Mikania micrantha]|uniref:Uncharacterized protein n=1 Tax=Mikania micrantha TaxID=192012 RepID=A0A5N6NIG3_9ASTR|nr:hypothetical protein E3N88_20100 [Mikania micrantha]
MEWWSGGVAVEIAAHGAHAGVMAEIADRGGAVMTGIRWPTFQCENKVKTGCLVESDSEETQFKHKLQCRSE